MKDSNTLKLPETIEKVSEDDDQHSESSKMSQSSKSSKNSKSSDSSITLLQSVNEDWFNLFDSYILPRVVLEHVVSIERKNYQIYIQTLETFPNPVLNFDTENEAIMAMQILHSTLVSHKITSRAVDEQGEEE